MISYQLSEIAHIRVGYPFRARIKGVRTGGVTVVQPRDLLETGALDVDSVIRTDLPQLKADYVLRSGDTLLAARGRIAAADYEGRPAGMCVASGALLILRPNSGDRLVPGYLTVFFNSEFGRSCITRIVAQTTATFVSRADLASLKIPLPDVDRQVRLIAMARNISRYARLVERRAKLLNSLVSYNTHT